ncbi:SPOR domain-containing protein [Pelagerythrobacter marensis]|uniref:Rare lipoprotein A n=1 Tax=Pelagerythrobacter marensis TaxID=543877 RepID=A0A0G3X7A8_9SPHN|nr:SPOR domain-containing protein [Pelagerythrobacter marensis]AKM07027.1 rare lipoprotein A [Pelagerythrobacter marensis]
MRLPDDRPGALLALTVSLTLAGCGLAGGGERPAAQGQGAAAIAPTGPAADYPVVLGEPYSIDGVEYAPTDAMNHDEVGYATLNRDAGAGVTVAHKTLPLPSYVEITALDSGRTILARVERRGPMTNARVVALSADAAAQLGAGEGAPVRVRRVNPPEVQRADLRAGRTAPLRMETPETLLHVLRRKLPQMGSVNLAGTRQPPVPSGVQAGDRASEPEANTPKPSGTGPSTYPLAPIGGQAVTGENGAAPSVAPTRPSANADGFVVQAAAFSSKANADRAARALGGFVSQAGRFYRVRTGPYESRGQAEAALAKVRAAGYSDARVFTAR